MNSDEQAIWFAAFGSAFAQAHASNEEIYATQKGCRDYARIVANDAVQAYKELVYLDKVAQEVA